MAYKYICEFKSFGKIRVNGKWDEYAVENPTDCINFSHLIGELVKIDHETFRIYAVNAHCGYRHYAGEKIGLVVLDKEQ